MFRSFRQFTSITLYINRQDQERLRFYNLFRIEKVARRRWSLIIIWETSHNRKTAATTSRMFWLNRKRLLKENWIGTAFHYILTRFNYKSAPFRVKKSTNRSEINSLRPCSRARMFVHVCGLIDFFTYRIHSNTSILIIQRVAELIDCRPS